MGPRRQQAGAGMSRDEFSRYTLGKQHEQSRTAAAAAAGAAGVAGAGKKSVAGSLAGPTASPSLASLPLASRPSYGGVQPSVVAEEESYDGLGEGEEGGAGMGPGLGPLAALPDAPTLLTGARPRPPKEVPPKPPTPDINAALVGAPDWGRSAGSGRAFSGHPALQATRPDDTVWEAEGGCYPRGLLSGLLGWPRGWGGAGSAAFGGLRRWQRAGGLVDALL